MDDVLKLVDYFAKESEVIRQSPAIFITALILLGGLIWVVVNRSFSLRLTNAESSKALLEDRIRDYQEKLNGASPKEAQTKIAQLEATVAELVAHRKPFSDIQLERMTQSLDGLAGTIAVTADVGSADPATEGKLIQMRSFFRQEGWRVRSFRSSGADDPPRHGLVIYLRDGNAETDCDALTVALKAAGIEYELRRQDWTPDSDPLQLNFSDED